MLERDHPESHRKLGTDLTCDRSHQLLNHGFVRYAVTSDLKAGHFPSELNLHALDSDPVVAIASHRYCSPSCRPKHIRGPIRSHRPEEIVVIGRKQVFKHPNGMPT